MPTLEIPAPGKEVLVLGGRFKVLSHLGGGGMAEVYLAEQISLGRKVALKVLKRDLGKQPVMAERFRREARLLSTVEHPAVVRVIDFDSSPEATILVLELAEGETLERVLKQGPLSPNRAVPVLAQIAEGLSAIHERGIVHRDIKPQNVVLTPGARGDQARLLDFGIARLMEMSDADGDEAKRDAAVKHTEGSPFVSHPGQVVGTPAYVAPEQATAQPLDARTDVYSFGVMAYRALSGQFPFPGPGSNDFLKQHVEQAPKPLDAAFPGLSERPGLVALVMQCLEKKPDARPADGQALLTALLPMMPVSPYESSIATPSRRVMMAIPAAAAMATPLPAAPETTTTTSRLKKVTSQISALGLKRVGGALRRAGRLDPLWRRSVLWTVLIVLVATGAFAMWPPTPTERTAQLIRTGHAEDALAKAKDLIAASPKDVPEAYALEAAALHKLGREDEERQVLRDVPYEALHAAHPLLLEALAEDLGKDEDDRELRALVGLVPKDELLEPFRAMARGRKSLAQWGALRYLDVTQQTGPLSRMKLYAQALSNQDCEVRARAAGRLAELGDTDAIAPLRDLSETPKEETPLGKVNCGQDQAAEAIRQLKKTR